MNPRELRISTDTTPWIFNYSVYIAYGLTRAKLGYLINKLGKDNPIVISLTSEFGRIPHGFGFETYNADTAKNIAELLSKKRSDLGNKTLDEYLQAKTPWMQQDSHYEVSYADVEMAALIIEVSNSSPAILEELNQALKQADILVYDNDRDPYWGVGKVDGNPGKNRMGMLVTALALANKKSPSAFTHTLTSSHPDLKERLQLLFSSLNELEKTWSSKRQIGEEIQIAILTHERYSAALADKVQPYFDRAVELLFNPSDNKGAIIPSFMKAQKLLGAIFADSFLKNLTLAQFEAEIKTNFIPSYRRLAADNSSELAQRAEEASSGIYSGLMRNQPVHTVYANDDDARLISRGVMTNPDAVKVSADKRVFLLNPVNLVAQDAASQEREVVLETLRTVLNANRGQSYKLLIPVNDSNVHWRLAIVDVVNGNISSVNLWDSLGDNGGLHHAGKILQGIIGDKTLAEFTKNSKITVEAAGIQKDGYQCLGYVLQKAFSYFVDTDLTPDQRGIKRASSSEPGAVRRAEIKTIRNCIQPQLSAQPQKAAQIPVAPVSFSTPAAKTTPASTSGTLAAKTTRPSTPGSPAAKTARPSTPPGSPAAKTTPPSPAAQPKPSTAELEPIEPAKSDGSLASRDSKQKKGPAKLPAVAAEGELYDYLTSDEGQKHQVEFDADMAEEYELLLRQEDYIDLTPAVEKAKLDLAREKAHKSLVGRLFPPKAEGTCRDEERTSSATADPTKGKLPPLVK